MTTIKCVAGDTGDVRTVSLGGLDLTGATGAVGHVKRAGEATVVLATTLNIPAKTAAVNFGPWLGTAGVIALTTPTRFNLQIQLTYPAGNVTWPSGAPDKVEVTPQLA